MGVDVSIFAKESKLRYDADRAWVVQAWNSEGYIEELNSAFRNSSKGLDYEQALFFLNDRIKYHSENLKDEPHRFDYAKYWLDKMIGFVNLNPKDTFFILNDHEDEFFEIYDSYQRFTY